MEYNPIILWDYNNIMELYESPSVQHKNKRKNRFYMISITTIIIIGFSCLGIMIYNIFQSIPIKPDVITHQSIYVGSSIAEFTGEIDTKNLPIGYYFEYGPPFNPNQNFTHITPINGTATEYKYKIAGNFVDYLDGNTEYSFRLVAKYLDQYYPGQWQYFRTFPRPLVIFDQIIVNKTTAYFMAESIPNYWIH
jgi:hypothetical protein